MLVWTRELVNERFRERDDADVNVQAAPHCRTHPRGKDLVLDAAVEWSLSRRLLVTVDSVCTTTSASETTPMTPRRQAPTPVLLCLFLPFFLLLRSLILVTLITTRYYKLAFTFTVCQIDNMRITLEVCAMAI